MKRFFEVISEYAALPKEERPILPKRQTKNSAGYDFYALEDVVIPAHEERNLNTGIKACMPADEHLELFIRSSYGIKYGLMLNNCVGIIDADYQSRRKTPVFRHGDIRRIRRKTDVPTVFA